MGADVTTLNENTRSSPLDGTEYARLATTGANWKVQLGTTTFVFGGVAGGTASNSDLNLYSTTGAGTTDRINFFMGNNGSIAPVIITNNNDGSATFNGGELENVYNRALTGDSGFLWNHQASGTGRCFRFLVRSQSNLGNITEVGTFEMDVDTDTDGAMSAYWQFVATTAGATGATSFRVGSAGGGIEFFTNSTRCLFLDPNGKTLSLNSLGYDNNGNGVGSTVSQATSRTTGVTLNKIAGAITLVSAAGTATWNTFTVTNSTVAAVDTIIVNQATGANTYNWIVSGVSAGSFKISVSSVVGTATEAPVLNFVVIKGSTS